MDYKEFINQAAHTIKRAHDLNKQSKKQGLADLTNAAEAEGLKHRDIFEFGIQLAADGTQPEYINTILSNLIKTEQNETEKRLKIIKKEAVICIQKGFNSWLLLNTLFSLISDKEQKDVQNILMDVSCLNNAAFKEFFKMYYEVL